MVTRGTDKLNDHSKQIWEAAITAICLLLVFLLALVNSLSNTVLSFTLFYVLIVAIAAWNVGRVAGIFIAVVSSVALLWHEFRTADAHSFTGAFFWNLAVQIGIYLFSALLVSAVRNLTDTLERRVKDRTSELEKEIADRKQTEEQLRTTMQQFRQLAENISDAFWMRDAGESRMAYVSPAYEKIWARTTKALYQNPNLWLEAIHPEDRERVAHYVARAMTTRQTDVDFSQEYRIVRPDGSLRWIRDRAFPIRDAAGRVMRLVGIAEDITDRRRLEREILEISDREQGRIGQDLHDGLCQKLVSIAFDNNSLEQKLSSRSAPEATFTRQMAALLDDAITEARAVARGLFPVQLETDGLSVALEQLAANISTRAKVECRMECPQVVNVSDNAMATHLYRIAQEAVNNAIKHGKAKHIWIRLTGEGDLLELSVSDDGVGLAAQNVNANSQHPMGGMGLHIMDYRARTIGGSLMVGRGLNGGTVVLCSVRQQANGNHV